MSRVASRHTRDKILYYARFVWNNLHKLTIFNRLFNIKITCRLPFIPCFFLSLYIFFHYQLEKSCLGLLLLFPHPLISRILVASSLIAIPSTWIIEKVQSPGWCNPWRFFIRKYIFSAFFKLFFPLFEIPVFHSSLD